MALQDHTHCDEIIWGAEAMGVVIGLSKRKVFNLLDNNRLKGAKKIGRRWCIRRQSLMANFDPSTTTDNEES
jgi:excisionase family DNA binding protein